MIAESAWANQLILRGSVTMPAWVGAAARPPGDLDWMLPQPEVTPPDRFRPDPFHDTLKPVQEWPEAVHGAVRNEIWDFEDHDTGGRRVTLPPDGLNWVTELDESFPDDTFEHILCQLITDRPCSPDGIVFDPEEMTEVQNDDYSGDYRLGDGTSQLRLTVPWQAPDSETGKVQVDISFGERLPTPPVCTAVPRAGGQPPLGLWTPSRELSLAWKLYWLATDQDTTGKSAMKDVYDAVLLAESPGLHLIPRLQRVALGTESIGTLLSPTDPITQAHFPGDPWLAPPTPLAAWLSPTRIPSWTIDGPAPDGSPPAHWLNRLAAAVTTLL
ncbi:MAG TPA: nucleotidyl transferase AbiEii/AbiGii toxin family protein [Actinoplanes sp.]|nr:nucleotidyl transferase AbiEii/AbiGii toxin family protein [Actinoplanes sp.]